MAKAVLLLSGGLDSILAGRLLLEQGIDVEALNFTSPFCTCTPKNSGCSAAKRAADALGIPATIRACGEEYLTAIKRPRFGRGSGMNACLDCRIHLFSRAREYMVETSADFVATGEVLGERPMSQRRETMRIIERESGLEGLLVRPLSAQHFEPTLPEHRGLLDRTRLLAFQGRGRTPQIELAAKYDIRDYPCPAGGCLLTDKAFSLRFKELLEQQPDFGLKEARLLKWGRHFRLPSGVKLILGRDKKENCVLEHQREENGILLTARDVPGPTALIQGPATAQDEETAMRILAVYLKNPVVPLWIRRNQGADATEHVLFDTTPPNGLEQLKIGVLA